MTDPQSLELATVAARAADDKGGAEVLVVEVGEIIGICGYFVIVSASNPRLVRAVTEAVEQRVREELGESPRAVEGADGDRWVLIDYGDVVVHVFHAEERAYYRIERLYSDAPKHEWRPPGHRERSTVEGSDAGLTDVEASVSGSPAVRSTGSD